MAQNNKLFGEPSGIWVARHRKKPREAWLVETITVHHRRAWSGSELRDALNLQPVHP